MRSCDGDVDYFQIDPVAYRPPLGEPGMRAYRQRLEAIRASLAPEPPEPYRWSVPDRHERWVLDWNDRRLAVFDRDIDAIIRTHARDLRVAEWLCDTARALEEIGAADLAIDWARQATQRGPWHQSLQAADYWCGLLAQHRPDDVLTARLDVFRWWPSSTTAAGVHHAAGGAWPRYRDDVLATLADKPADAVLFAVVSLNDPDLAWELAHRLDLDDDRAWEELANAYGRVDPIAVLPIHRRLVERDLVNADAHNYRQAARRLATMRQLAAGTHRADDIDTIIAELRLTHRRRPRLQDEFDRARLP
jgi:hypothetical protein